MNSFDWIAQNEPPIDEDDTQPDVPLPRVLWTVDQCARHLGVTPIVFRLMAKHLTSVSCGGVPLYHADGVQAIADDPIAGELLRFIRERHNREL